MNETEPSVSTESQRRELDIMSARLLDNLNRMIAEQEARVQEFSLQQPNTEATPVSWNSEQQPAQKQAPLTITYSDGAHTGVVPAPRRKESASSATQKSQQAVYRDLSARSTAKRGSVTPPPGKQTAKVPPPTYRVPTPPLPRNTSIDKATKNESSVGCGTMAVIGAIIFLLLRACS